MYKSKRKIKNESLSKAYRRKLSIRKKINGTADSPRICAVKTNKNIQVQVIDDASGKTFFSVQTFGKSAVGSNASKESAKLVGAKVAEQMKEKNISKAVFDRNGKVYTGVIAQIADSIREGGIKI
jgi:large subunit ribosomal protein L18